jgi:hypothetical protein
MTPEQENSARDKLWTAAYRRWYESYFNEIVANRLVSRWQAFSDPSKVIIAVTASSSVIAGWTLWNQPGYRIFWIILAGIGAILSVINSSLTIPERIKDWLSTRSEFSHVRVETEVLMNRMKLHPDFNISEMEKALETQDRRFGEAVDRIRNDFLHTAELDSVCKSELDKTVLEGKLWT